MKLIEKELIGEYIVYLTLISIFTVSVTLVCFEEQFLQIRFLHISGKQIISRSLNQVFSGNKL